MTLFGYVVCIAGCFIVYRSADMFWAKLSDIEDHIFRLEEHLRDIETKLGMDEDDK